MIIPEGVRPLWPDRGPIKVKEIQNKNFEKYPPMVINGKDRDTGVQAPSKFSLVAAVNIYSFIILVCQSTPCTYVGYISFIFYLSLVGEALWGYLQANKIVSHQKNLLWPLVN